MFLIVALVASALMILISTSTAVEAASGTRVVITIHSLEVLDELEGLGDQADLAVVAWVDDGLVIDEGPYNDQDLAVVDIIHPFYCTNASFQFEMQVYEVDTLYNDEVDISAYEGGGIDDYSRASRGAAFVCVFDIGTGKLAGDQVELAGDWYVTNGEFDGSTSTDENDGRVLFDIEANREPTVRSIDPATSEVTVEEGQDQGFSVDVADPEGDALTLTWWIGGTSYEDRGADFTVSTRAGSEGTYKIRCEVCEGLSTVPCRILAWDLVVLKFNFPPVAVLNGPSSGKVFETLVFSAADSYDTDGTRPRFNWTVDGELWDDEERLYIFFVEPGAHKVELTASDGSKSSDATRSVDIQPIVMPSPTKEVINTGTVTPSTDYDYGLMSSSSWGMRITGCDAYAYYLNLGLWYEYQVEHQGSAEVSLKVFENGTDRLDLQVKLVSSQDMYSVKFRPTLFVQIEKRYMDGRPTDVLVHAPLPLPSMVDADGDGTSIQLGGETIYLWDSWVEIYHKDGADILGDFFDHDYQATLASIDVLDLIQQLDPLIPGISLVASILDVFIDVQLEFNLNIVVGFSEDLVLFDDMERADGTACVNFYQPEEDTTVDTLYGIMIGAPNYAALHTYMDTEVYGSMDLVVSLDYTSILTDFVDFLLGKETEELSYPLLRSGSIYGSTEGLTLTDVSFTARRVDLVTPTVILKDVTEDGASLEWVKSPDAIAQEYRVYVTPLVQPVPGQTSPYAIVKAPECQVVLGNLQADTEYWVVVEAVGGDLSHKSSPPFLLKTEASEATPAGVLAGRAPLIGIAVAAILVVLLIVILIARGRRRTSTGLEGKADGVPIAQLPVSTVVVEDSPKAEAVPKAEPPSPKGAEASAMSGMVEMDSAAVKAEEQGQIPVSSRISNLPRFCPQCGAKFDEAARFCKDCGHAR